MSHKPTRRNTNINFYFLLILSCDKRTMAIPLSGESWENNRIHQSGLNLPQQKLVSPSIGPLSPLSWQPTEERFMFFSWLSGREGFITCKDSKRLSLMMMMVGLQACLHPPQDWPCQHNNSSHSPPPDWLGSVESFCNDSVNQRWPELIHQEICKERSSHHLTIRLTPIISSQAEGGEANIVP